MIKNYNSFLTYLRLSVNRSISNNYFDIEYKINISKIFNITGNTDCFTTKM